MDKRNGYRRHSGAGKVIAAVLLVLVLLCGAAWFVLFRINQFSLSVQLLGEKEATQEYGQPYQDPGVVVSMRGSLFWKKGFRPKHAKLKVTGKVDENHLGKYTLSYSASMFHWHGSTQRSVQVVDTQCPVITLEEDTQGKPHPGGKYQEPGYKAWDNCDGDITDRVVRKEARGKITYAVVDSSGNPATAEREIPYYDPQPPVISLEGGETYAITVGTFYEDPGYHAMDDVDGDLTGQVTVEGEVNWLQPGVYPVVYTVSDAYQNVATVTRNVEVVAQPRPEKILPQEKTIYLTFDDGPGPYTKQLLDVLDAYGVKATFFVTDSGYDSVMKEIVDRGHSIGIHTVSHKYDEIYASPEAYFADLLGMQDIIYRNTGVKTTLMRFPGGSSNLVSRKSCEGIMTVLSEAVQDAGFQYFDWNVDSDDAGRARKAEEVFDNVVDGVKKGRVSAVLQHDIHGYSVEAVEKILKWGQENGYTFRPLEQTSPGFHHGINN